MRVNRSERGATLITVALMLVALLSFLALAIDIGVGYAERRRTQNAADAAALAGVQVMAQLSSTDAQIRAAINDYAINQNGAASWTGSWTVSATPVANITSARPANTTGVQVTVRGSTPTFFASILGITTVTSQSSGGGGFTPLDIVLVIDKSGSMDDDSCYLKNTTSGPNLRDDFAIANHCGNFSGGVINQTYCGQCGGTSWRSSTSTCYWRDGGAMNPWPAVCGTKNQSNCLACRGVWKTPPQPVQDTKTAANNFVSRNNPALSKLGLVTFGASAQRDVHLTNVYANVTTGINAISIQSDCTNAADGLQKSLDEHQQYGRSNAIKFVVFMTDGVPNCPQCNNGCKTPGCCPAAVNAAYTVANTAASRAIVIYTIGLGAYGDVDHTMLQSVANRTGGEYFYAPTSTDLDAVYSTIFERIRLRLEQ